MGSVLKLPCIRFVRQVSNGVSLSKYGYIGMMERNAQAIQSAAWRKAACRIDDVALTVNKVTETDGEWDAEGGKWLNRPTYSAWLQDRFDCFIQGGDAVKELGTFCGYAGMVAYRFTLPTVNPGAIDEIKLLIQRDRYLRAGVRVAVEINDSASPSNDWQVLRGENDGAIASPSSPSGGVVGVASWGFLHQYDVPFLMASRAWEGTLELSRDSFPGLDAAASGKYLWVYMSPEDFCSYWDMYDAKEQRFYSIEGSAALLSGCCTFAFSTDAVAPEAADAMDDDLLVEDLVNQIEAGFGHDEFGNFGRYCGLVGAVLDLPADDVRSSAALMNLLKGVAEDDLGINASALDKSNVSIKYSLSGRFGLIGNASLHSRNTPCVFIAGRKRQTSHPGYTSSDGEMCIKNPLRMVLGYQILPIPATISEFKEYELIFSSTGGQVVNELKFGLPGLKFNLWKSSSPDFMGPWANVAGAALAKNGAMFTAAAEQIEGSIQGTGELTKHITITASAKLVRSFSFGDLLPVGKNIALLKCEDAKPGDTLILAPNISLVRPVPLDSSADGECVACWYYAPSKSEHSAPVYLQDAPRIDWAAHAVRGRIQA